MDIVIKYCMLFNLVFLRLWFNDHIKNISNKELQILSFNDKMASDFSEILRIIRFTILPSFSFFKLCMVYNWSQKNNWWIYNQKSRQKYFLVHNLRNLREMREINTSVTPSYYFFWLFSQFHRLGLSLGGYH